MNKTLTGFAIALSMSVPALVAAQASSGDLAFGKATPPLRYQSAFDDYKPYRDVSLGNWRAVNDTVASASGGARGQAGHPMGGMGGTSGTGGMESVAAPAAPASTPVPMRATPEMPMRSGHAMPGAKK